VTRYFRQGLERIRLHILLENLGALPHLQPGSGFETSFTGLNTSRLN
jgi:hypothetical protein